MPPRPKRKEGRIHQRRKQVGIPKQLEGRLEGRPGLIGRSIKKPLPLFRRLLARSAPNRDLLGGLQEVQVSPAFGPCDANKPRACPGRRKHYLTTCYTTQKQTNRRPLPRTHPTPALVIISAPYKHKHLHCTRDVSIRGLRETTAAARYLRRTDAASSPRSPQSPLPGPPRSLSIQRVFCHKQIDNRIILPA